MSLYEDLIKYKNEGPYPFCMPGHKRNPEFLPGEIVDITEVEGFDDLHDPKGIIRECEKKAAHLYDDSETFFMVNGSTAGILAAIMAVKGKNGKYLAARNCHKSVYNGICLAGAPVSYIYPERDKKYGYLKAVDPAEVEKILGEGAGPSEDRIREKYYGVIVTSPTYDGVVSDIKAIGDICHKYKVPLIVDEAHGAHFGMDERLPGTSAGIGDIVIHSLHKTLPALNQTALIHVSGDLVDRDRLRYYLSVFQTSSPSYPLMASMDSCMELLRDKDRIKGLYNRLFSNIDRLKEALQDTGFSIINTDDATRLLLGEKDGRPVGRLLQTILRKEGIEPEMATDKYVVLISTLCDTDRGFDILIKACKKAEEELGNMPLPEPAPSGPLPGTISVFSMSDAEGSGAKSFIPVEDSLGSIAAGPVFAYPPGIPLVTSGEVITEDIIKEIDHLRKADIDLKGLRDGKISVLRMDRNM